MTSKRKSGEKNLAMKKKFMGFGWDQIPRFILRIEEIGPSDKLVFSFIVNRMRDFGGGMAFPSIETIAVNNALSKATVKRSTAALINLGLLVRHPRGMGKTNEYEMPEEIPAWILEKYGADITPRDQNDPPEGAICAPTGRKKSRINRVLEIEEEEGDPTGADCDPPEPRKAGKKKAPLKRKGEEKAPAGWASTAPFVSENKTQTVCASGSGKVMPWEREEEPQGLRRGRKGNGKVKKRGLFDPDKDPSEWNGNDLVGYFRECFKRTFPGEGAPDVRIEDLGAAKRRITWMQNEEMDVAIAKQAVDHLFANWGNGLPARLRWKGSRPGIALIETARFFETLVREVQSGVPSGGTLDEFNTDAETLAKYQKEEEICARLISEGKSLEEADREAKRLAGL